MLILWREQAAADLAEAIDYLLERNPRAARHLRDSIIERVALLADFPGLGRPGRVAETRELIVAGTPYLVAYTLDRRVDAVIILRVLHGARVWPIEL